MTPNLRHNISKTSVYVFCEVVKDPAGLVMHLHCLLFASRAVLPQRIETKERGRTGKTALPISDNTHSVSLLHTYTTLTTMR